MVRIILNIETANEPESVVFNRVLFKLQRDELIHSASFEYDGEDSKLDRASKNLKARVREWQKKHKVPFTVMAEKMGTSIGYVKNMLYSTTLKITPARAEQFEQLMKETF
jgi:hypothetical protein